MVLSSEFAQNSLGGDIAYYGCLISQKIRSCILQFHFFGLFMKGEYCLTLYLGVKCPTNGVFRSYQVV